MPGDAAIQPERQATWPGPRSGPLSRHGRRDEHGRSAVTKFSRSRLARQNPSDKSRRLLFSMSVTVQMEGDYLLIEFAGAFTTDDIPRLIQSVKEFEAKLGYAPKRIIDLTGIESMAVSFPDIAEIVKARRSLTYPNLLRSALVADRPVQFGLARMVQSLNQHEQITMEIFPSRAAAQAWLEAEPHAPELD